MTPPLVPGGIPTDAELITLLRQRLATVDDAIEAYIEVMARTATAREAAWKTMKALHPKRTESSDDAMAFLTARDRFTQVYEDTMPAREEAAKALTDALTMDFRTALLCAVDTTPEHIQHWLGEREGACGERS